MRGDHSHNLPKGRFPNLETDPRNISIRCPDCHEALDKEDFSKIKDFKDLDQIMEYRIIMEPFEYNKFVIGLHEVGCEWMFTK